MLLLIYVHMVKGHLPFWDNAIEIIFQHYKLIRFPVKVFCYAAPIPLFHNGVFLYQELKHLSIVGKAIEPYKGYPQSIELPQCFYKLMDIILGIMQHEELLFLRLVIQEVEGREVD